MPPICEFRGIKIIINYREHRPPHFHAFYGGDEVLIDINEAEVYEGHFPKKQLKLILAWAVLHKDELLDNWQLAESHKELFEIEPLK